MKNDGGFEAATNTCFASSHTQFPNYVLRGFLGTRNVCLKICTAIVVQLQSNSSDVQHSAHHNFKDEQAIFQHLEIVTFLITTCAPEKILEKLWSAVTNESIAEVMR